MRTNYGFLRTNSTFGFWDGEARAGKTNSPLEAEQARWSDSVTDDDGLFISAMTPEFYFYTYNARKIIFK